MYRYRFRGIGLGIATDIVLRYRSKYYAVKMRKYPYSLEFRLLIPKILSEIKMAS